MKDRIESGWSEDGMLVGVLGVSETSPTVQPVSGLFARKGLESIEERLGWTE